MRTQLLTGLLVLVLAGTAPAALIDYTVQNGGFGGGFGASGVHTGGDSARTVMGLDRSHDNSMIGPVDTDFFASGSAKVGFPLNGVIHGDLNEATDTLMILPSLLTAAQGTLMLTGGTIGYDSVAGREFGHIDYLLTDGMGMTAGKFYFYPVAFAGPANTTDFTVSGGYILTLWGNDWENHMGVVDGLGVDLRAHGALIAEPGSLCLLGIGCLLVLAVRRQRRRTTA